MNNSIIVITILVITNIINRKKIECTQDQTKDGHILNGIVVEDNDGLSVVRIETGTEQTSICTGTLIGPKYVITAGHCVTNEKSEMETNIRVMYGSNRIDDCETIVADKAELHPDYTTTPTGMKMNDFAIIILKDSLVKTDKIKYAELEFGKSLLKTYKAIYGWGRSGTIQKNALSKRLMKVDHLLIWLDMPGMIYLRDERSNAWKGDSGGPMFDTVTGKMIAVAASVQSVCSCSGRLVPAKRGAMIYSKIRPARQWIESIIK